LELARIIIGRPSHPLVGQTCAFRMKFFWIGTAVAIFLILDHVYADGRGADELFSVVRRLGLSIAHWSDDVLRPLRR
jgi:hypothetical protein